MFDQFKHHKSLTLLVSLLLLILIFPFFEMSRITQVLFVILYTTVLLAGVNAISYEARYIAVGMLLIAPTLICQWSNIILNNPAIDLLGRMCSAIFMLYTLVALLKRILTVKKVGPNEIYGAICAYILIGTMFGLLYALIESVNPGSFHFDYDKSTQNLAPFIYFSFVALSTVGFGDIVAVGAFARALVIIEMIIGVTYIGVLIGRLVSASFINPKEEKDLALAEKHQKEKGLQELLREPILLKERPIGVIAASIMFNFMASVFMIHLHLPFFMDSWGTSLAVMLSGLWPGALVAISYHILMALTYWDWSSWVWSFSSLFVAGATWFFFRRGWVSLYKPFHLIASGIVIGIFNGILAQIIATLAHLPTYPGALPVYSFFLNVTSNKTFAAIAEKMFVEVADKTIAIMIASVAIYLLQDFLKTYKRSLES